jgi:CheY-like chemotaxis protein
MWLHSLTEAWRNDRATFRVLVVDDEPDLREFVVEVLSSHGLRTLAAASSYNALQIVAAEHVDLLVTDIVMSGKTGVELAAEVKRLRPEIKVLFVTGHAPRSTEQAAMRLGKTLFKPLRAPDIIREVTALLETSGAPENLWPLLARPFSREG